jgi:hypothetical protein
MLFVDSDPGVPLRSTPGFMLSTAPRTDSDRFLRGLVEWFQAETISAALWLCNLRVLCVYVVDNPFRLTKNE